MPNLFEAAKLRAPQYSWSNLSHFNKLSLDFGRNVPVWNVHVFSGDRFIVGEEHLIRFSPLLAPVMEQFDIRIDSVFVPERIIWDDSQNFYRGGRNGSSDYPVPALPLKTLFHYWYQVYLNDNTALLSTSSVNFLRGTLWDYFNLPTFEWLIEAAADTDSPIDTGIKFGVAVGTLLNNNPIGDKSITLVPFFSYQAVYREYYRDQFVDEPDVDPLGENGGPMVYTTYADYLPDYDAADVMLAINQKTDSTTSTDITKTMTTLAMRAFGCLMKLRDVNYPKDYFTSALPNPQLGSQPVSIPVSSYLYTENSGRITQAKIEGVVNSSSQTKYVTRLTNSTDTMAYGELSVVNEGTIPDLRKASKLQEFLEKSLLGGNRFIDWIKAHFGVSSSDARLDRPEFLSRAKDFVSISDVTQTSASTDASGSEFMNDSPLGEYAGHGLSAGGNHLFDQSFEEPGWLQVYISIVPKASYFQGIPKEFTKTDRFDFLIPEFAEIGMQPINKSELFGGIATDEAFGYTERYAEYRHSPSEIHGDFRDNLSYWHDARMFASAPALSSEFLKVSAASGDLNRIFAYVGDYSETGNNHIYALIKFHVKAYRALPSHPHYSL